MQEYWVSLPFWILAIVGVIMTGVSKSGFAGGAGVVAVPLLALVMPVPKAAALLLPLLIAMDTKTVWYYRSGIDWKRLTAILPAAIIGIALAGWAMKGLPSRWLQWALGIISILFALWARIIPILGRLKGSGFIWGCVSGVSSTLLHAGGPPISIYLLTQNIPKLTWLATAAVFFAVMNLVKVVPYTLNQQWSWELIKLDIALLPVAIFGIWLGKRIQQQLNNAHFTNICRGLLLVSGVALLGKALQG